MGNFRYREMVALSRLAVKGVLSGGLFGCIQVLYHVTLLKATGLELGYGCAACVTVYGLCLQLRAAGE